MNNQEMGQRHLATAYAKNEQAERMTQGHPAYGHFIDIQTQLMWAGVYFLADIAESLRQMRCMESVSTATITTETKLRPEDGEDAVVEGVSE